MKKYKHFAALAILGIAASQSAAAVVYSGILNIPVPGTFDGTYLNLQTGLATNTTAGNTDYDFNPYIATPGTSTGWSFFQPDGTNGGTLGATTTGPAVVVAPGAPIGPTSTFDEGTSDGTAFNGLTMVFVGVKSVVESNSSVHYGWVRVSLPTPVVGGGTQPTGTIVDYAFQTTNNGQLLAGQGLVAPEPTSIAALGLGATLLRRRRA